MGTEGLKTGFGGGAVASDLAHIDGQHMSRDDLVDFARLVVAAELDAEAVTDDELMKLADEALADETLSSAPHSQAKDDAGLRFNH